MKKLFALLGCSIFASTSTFADDIHLDLSSIFDQNAFISEEVSGDPLGDAGWIDANSLPADYSDGTPYKASPNKPAFLYGPLSTGENDSVLINGQTVNVESGNYHQLDLSLLSVEDFVDVQKSITLNYADGTSSTVPLGPLSDWFDSPLRFYDQFNSYTDESDVNEIIDITPQQNDEEFIAEIVGGSPNEPRDDFRFVDGSDVLAYEFDLDDDLESATLSIDMQNNFVVGISTDIGFEYTEVLNSQEMFGTAVHDGSNRDVYEVDLTPFLEAIPDNILWVRFTDGTPENGWGPAVFNVSVFTGELQRFEFSPESDVSASGEIFADFRTDGGETEQSFIHQSSGTTLSGVDHRFADGTGSVTYRFYLPDDTTEAKLAANMEANFNITATAEFDQQTHVNFAPGDDRDEEYIIENTAQNAGSYRFVDAGSRLMYAIDLPDDLTQAELSLELENNFVVSVGPSESDLTEELNSFDLFGEDIHDASNRDFYSVNLAPYLAGNANNEIFILFVDGSPGDGWGPAVRTVSVTSGEAPEFSPVFNASEATADSTFAYNGESTVNKKFYEIDLSAYLEGNESNTVYVRFSDQTTDNGFGPGLFRLVMFNGELNVNAPSLAIQGLQPTGDAPDSPYPWGINMTQKSYPVNADKVLESITVPSMDDDENIYLFAGTLVTSDTQINHWTLF